MPLSSLIPSLDAHVLDVLAGTESGLGVSQIQRLARRGARSGIHRTIDRLCEHGLVIAQPTNVGHIYRLNREHVLADAILIAHEARSEFFIRLRSACNDFEPKLLGAAIFGSTARRESDASSDIDLVLVVAKDADDARVRDAVVGLEDQVFVWTGNRLECLVFTNQELRELAGSGEPMVEILRSESVAVFGHPIAQLLEIDQFA